MRFYICLWKAEGCPEGIGYNFFMSKTEANAFAADLRRKIREEYKRLMEEADEMDIVNLKDVCKSETKAIEVDSIDIPEMSKKQMIFWALKYQVVE